MNNNRFTRAKDLSPWLPVVAVVLFWVFYLLPGAVESSDVRGPQDYLADTAFSKGLLFWVFVFSPVTLICLACGYFGQWMVRRNNILYLSIVAVMILCSFFPPVGILAMYSVILLSMQYMYSQKDGFHLFDKRKLMVLGALSSLYVLFLEISVYWHLSSVFNLGLLACMLPMLYWLSAAVFCRQPRGRLSWLLAFVAIALTVAAVILGQLNGYVFLWMVLPLVVALGLYNHCCKHLSNKIISLVAIVTLITSCNTVTYKYQDRPYLDLDMPVLDFEKMSQQEAEILSEAEVRVGIFERERGTRDYAFNGPYGLIAPNGASVNISERLYDFIWETNVHYYRELSARGGGGIIDTDALLKEPKEDLIYALMHSGNKSKDWSNAEYNKLCRYANRIQKDWKEQGFSLEEMDMLAQRCKGLHRKELVLSQADSMREFNRSVVLVWSEWHQRLYAVNAVKMERRHGKDSDPYLLRTYNFHWNPKYGHRMLFKPEEVKFIYE